MKKQFSLLIGCLVCAFIFMSATIDLDNLFNYANQDVPGYITKDNTTTNTITDEVTTLGRVLFYDTNLSANNTIACASCHIQEKAFGDVATLSVGLNGELTGRHSMRLINSRFADEDRFFWDERAATLEEQTTRPIQDHVEMGFSGTDGDPDIDDLITSLEAIDYYQDLFGFAYGDTTITEARLQEALAQFIRSIQSFDSEFDTGLAQVNNLNQDFPNYTAEENQGKQLFISPPQNGGAGCIACHRAPEFDIDPNSLNNGIIRVAGSLTEIDLTNTRSPSLRDLVNPNGSLNGPLMHNGNPTSLLEVINHYNQIQNDPANTNLDPRLTMPGGQTQSLNLTDAEKDALVAFLRTLTGNDVYTNEKWSNPFEDDGSITIIGGALSTQEEAFNKRVSVYPNPIVTTLTISIDGGNYKISIYDLNGKKVFQDTTQGDASLQLEALQKGIYVLNIEDLDTRKSYIKKLIKQ
jgi:cytochrome c peroxidase